MKIIKKLFKNEEGATAIEYGLIAALIGVASITAVGLVGDELEPTCTPIHTKLGAAPMSPVTTPMPKKLMRWRAMRVWRSPALANSANTSKAMTR